MGTVQVCASVLGIPVSESLLEKWRRWYSPALQPFPIDDVIAVERAQLPHRVMQPSDEVRDTFFLYQGEWAWLQENEFRALPAELREPAREVAPLVLARPPAVPHRRCHCCGTRTAPAPRHAT